MFWNKHIKSSEFKELDKKISEVEYKINDVNKKLNSLEIDMSLFWDKLNKAIKRRAFKDSEMEMQSESNLNNQILPM